MSVIKFKKSELSFLETFKQCVDSSVDGGDTFNIQSKNDKIYFSQVGSNTYTLFEIEKTGEICLSFKTGFVANLIKTLKDDDFISFSEKGIEIGNTGFYESVVNDEVNPVLNDMIMYSESDKYTTINIKNLDKLSYVNSFVGSDDIDLSSVALNDGHFVSSDMKVICIGKTDNDKDISIAINSFVSKLISFNKLSEINVKILEMSEDNKFYSFDFNGCKVFVPVKPFQLLNVNFMEKEHKEKFYHDYKIIFDKVSLKNSLDRLNLIKESSNFYRVFVSYFKDYVLIESKDFNSNKAKEKVMADVDVKLVNDSKPYQVLLSTSNLLQIVNTIKSDTVVMRTVPSSNPYDIRSVCFSDMDEKDYFIHVAYEDVPVEDNI